MGLEIFYILGIVSLLRLLGLGEIELGGSFIGSILFLRDNRLFLDGFEIKFFGASKVVDLRHLIRHYSDIFICKGYLDRIIFLLLYFIFLLLYLCLFFLDSILFFVICFVDERLVDPFRHVRVFILLHKNIVFLRIGGFFLLLDEGDLGRLLMKE